MISEPTATPAPAGTTTVVFAAGPAVATDGPGATERMFCARIPTLTRWSGESSGRRRRGRTR